MASEALVMRFHEHLVELRRVPANVGEVIRAVEAEFGVLECGGTEEMTHLGGEFGEVDRAHDEGAFSRVGEHLVGKFGGALGRGLDTFDVLAGGRVIGQARECEGRRSQGRPTSRLLKSCAMPPARTPRPSSFLGVLYLGFELPVFRFGPLVFGHVAGDSLDTDGLTVLVDEACADFDGDARGRLWRASRPRSGWVSRRRVCGPPWCARGPGIRGSRSVRR